MKTDAQLKTEVTRELEWDPSVNATHIGVAAKDGVVTLTGHLGTYAEKYAAERAAQRVEGVKALAVEIDVRIAPGHQRSDTEIAEAIEMVFKWNSLLPAKRIRVLVEKGWVTLSGEFDWEYQRRAAEKAVRSLTGVTGVNNLITIKSQVTPANIAQRIREALERHAEREAKNIEVHVSGSTVTLRGRVSSWADRAAAQGAAWSAPGINEVINDLNVGISA